MNIKRWTVTFAVIGAVSVGVLSASAQGERLQRGRDGGIRDVLWTVIEETGLDIHDVMQQLRDGSTLAEVVEANGGDVQAVIDAAVAAASERLNEAVSNGRITQEQADLRLSEFEAAVEEAVHSGRPGGPTVRGLVRGGEHILAQAVAEATGLEVSDLLPLLREGSTLAEIAEENGADVDAIIADGVADATERIEASVANGGLTREQADELIANLETLFTNAMTSTVREFIVETYVGVGVLRMAAEQTGLLPREITEQMRSGSTLAQILTENGVDVNAFIEDVLAEADERLDQAVENGRITQERADEILENLREHLNERLNTTNPL
jgi:hypothetical protein